MSLPARSLFVLGLACGALAPTARAQALPVGPFVGTWSDGLENSWYAQVYNPWSCLLSELFFQRADLCTTDGDLGITLATSWVAACKLQPSNGDWFVFSKTGTAEVTFTLVSPERFGFYMGSVWGDTTSATVHVFDRADQPIGTFVEEVPADCGWRWIGWESVGAPIGRVTIEHSVGGGGYLFLDDFQMAEVDDDVTIGTSYCGPAQLNSSGQAAVIEATGSPAVADDALALQARSMPANQFGLLLVSDTQDFVVGPGGSQGNLCLGGAIGRFQPALPTGAFGRFWREVDLGALPLHPPHPVQPGETWNFQAWYRDDNPGPTSNFTDATAITFE